MTLPDDELTVANDAFWNSTGGTSDGIRAAILAVDAYRLRKIAEQERDIQEAIVRQLTITHAFIFGSRQ